MSWGKIRLDAKPVKVCAADARGGGQGGPWGCKVAAWGQESAGRRAGYRVLGAGLGLV